MPVRRPIAIAACVCLAGSAGAQVADFEGLAEGFHGNTLVSGGIVFSRPWDRLDPPDSGQIFAIDYAASLAESFPGTEAFVSGNVLNINGYVGGSGHAVLRVGSLDMTPASVRTSVSVSLIYLVSDPRQGLDLSGNSVGLEAYRDGVLVGSAWELTDDVQYTTATGVGIGVMTLSLSGVAFDMVRFVTDGPAEGGAALMSLDNVVMIPAPGAAGVAGAVGALVVGVRRRR